MHASDALDNAAASDRELLFSRVFDAPRHLVYEAWTNPKHVTKWWGPKGFTATIHEMDVRPGGNWHMVMHGPDGRNYNNRIVFLEVQKPERLVYKHEPEPGSEPVSFQVTVTFEAEGARTKVTMHMSFASTAERDFVNIKDGASEGAVQHFACLADYLTTMTPEAA